MPDPTPTYSPPASRLERVLVPAFLFTSLFCLMLMFSWFFILPQWYTVAVAGHTIDRRDLQRQRAELTASITDLAQQQEQTLLPVNDAAYVSLQRTRLSQRELPTLLEQIHLVAQRADAVVEAVHVSRIAFDHAAHTLTLTGDVHGVQFRSMSVLAQFAEGLAALPGIDHLDPPAFAREDDPVKGPYSPFTITLHLAP